MMVVIEKVKTATGATAATAATAATVALGIPTRKPSLFDTND